MCEKFCNGFLFLIYISPFLMGAYFIILRTIYIPFNFPDNSIFKNDQVLIDLDYYNISSFPYLKDIYKQYGKNIYYSAELEVSINFNFVVIPTFLILNIIFSGNFILCNSNKIPFLFIGFYSFVVQIIPYICKIFSDNDRRNLPKYENITEGLKDIFNSYNNYRDEASIIKNDTEIIKCLSIELGIFLFVITIKTYMTSSSEEKSDRGKLMILCHPVFGLISAGIFAISPFLLYYPCKSRYSDNFLPDKYYFSKMIETNISALNNGTSEYIIEEYNYQDYPILKELYDIYNNDRTNKEFNLLLDYNKYGELYVLGVVAGMPLLSIISFILLTCSKYKGKYSYGFIIIELFSLELKLVIIMFPLFFISNKYEKYIANNDEEIKHLINDYDNYSKYKKKIPIIFYLECIYIFLEIIMFFVFLGEKNKKKENSFSENKEESLIQKEGTIKEEVNPKVVYKERFTEVEPKKVRLKFKDNKNHEYEIEVGKKRRFNDVLNELIGREEFLKSRKIRSVLYGNRYLYLTYIRCLETIEELNINDESDYIYIYLQEPQSYEINHSELIINNEQDSIIINEPLNFPKLEFCIINLENKKIEIERKEDATFENVLQELRKKDQVLKDCMFKSIFYYDREVRIKIEGQNRNKKISELNIPKNEIIYIKVILEGNTPITITFIWKYTNIRYEFQTGRKEKFHSVAMEFMGIHNEFTYYIITKFYFNKNRIIDDELSIDPINNNCEINLDDEIETEYDINIKTLEDLRITDGAEIFFETRYNVKVNDSEKLYKSYCEFNFLNEKGFKMLAFKTSKNDRTYPIIVNERDKFKDAIFIFKRDYSEFQNSKINAALLRGTDLMREEKYQSEIKDLNIKYDEFIILIIDV